MPRNTERLPNSGSVSSKPEETACPCHTEGGSLSSWQTCRSPRRRYQRGLRRSLSIGSAKGGRVKGGTAGRFTKKHKCLTKGRNVVIATLNDRLATFNVTGL